MHSQTRTWNEESFPDVLFANHRAYRAGIRCANNPTNSGELVFWHLHTRTDWVFTIVAKDLWSGGARLCQPLDWVQVCVPGRKDIAQ